MAIPSSASRGAFWALACLVAGVAVFWRVETLGSRPLWFDERWTARVVAESQDLRSLWNVAKRDHYQHPPLGYAAARLATSGEPSPTRLRAPALLAGLASIALVGAIGGALFGRWAGLLAAFVASISVYHVDSSQDARPYMLGVAFTTALYGALFAYLSKPRIGWLVALAVAALGAVYTYHLALAHLAVAAGTATLHCLALVRRGEGHAARRAAVAFAATLACVALLYVPQLPNLIGFFDAPGLGANHRLAPGPAFLHALFQRWGSGSAWTAHAYAAMLVAGAVRLAARRDLVALAILGWAVAPFAVFALIPFSKYFDIRFLISSLPVFFLLTGAGIDGVARAIGRRAGSRVHAVHALVAALLAALFAVPAVGVYATFRETARRCGDVVNEPEILEANDRFCAEHLLLSSIVPEQQWVLRSLAASIELDPAQLDEYAGAYRFEAGPPLVVRRDGAHLFIEVEGQHGYELLPAAADQFHYRVLPDRHVRFSRDATGRVTALLLERRGERAQALRE